MSTELLWAYYRKRQTGFAANEEIQIRNAIALANDKLAKMVARRLQARCSLPLDDLIQLSRLGMLKAIPKYDPSKNAAFSSFVVPYCEGEIKHFLRDHRNLVKTPRRWQEKSDEVRSIQLKVAKRGRLISANEAATVGARLPILQWEAIVAATAQRPLMELDDQIQIAAEPSESLEEIEFAEQLKTVLMTRLKELPEQIQECLVERFWGDLSEEIIAKRHGISILQVSELINQGLKLLREAV